MIAHASCRIARAIAAFAAATVLAACSTVPPDRGDARGAEASAPAAVPTRRAAPAVADRAAAIALDQVGRPYRYGGQSPSTGFDCSGLVHYAYAQAGKSVPRTTGTLWSGTRRVPREALEAGDLVFFSIEGKMQHVGLYVGGGRFVHAPSTGRTVSVESLSSPFYRQALLGGGRPR